MKKNLPRKEDIGESSVKEDMVGIASDEEAVEGRAEDEAPSQAKGLRSPKRKKLQEGMMSKDRPKRRSTPL